MSKKKIIGLPTIQELLNPVLKAIHDLGYSGSNIEIIQRTALNLQLSEDLLSTQREAESRTEFDYRIAWALYYLKKFGILESSKRGIYAIVSSYKTVKQVNADEIVRYCKGQKPQKILKTNETDNQNQTEIEIEIEDIPNLVQSWRERLYYILTDIIDFAAFERLCLQFLRESGFVSLEVTKRTRDGGIDGKGIIKIHNLVSFHVVFQCKKYKGSVTSSHVRDFRGAMSGRADKGLLITTGTFTQDAIKEAIRDGAIPIDLVSGEKLIDMIKELGFGIKTELIEKVEIDEIFYKSI